MTELLDATVVLAWNSLPIGHQGMPDKVVSKDFTHTLHEFGFNLIMLVVLGDRLKLLEIGKCTTTRHYSEDSVKKDNQ
eukprot:6429674-Amphidinium_carterae.1